MGNKAVKTCVEAVLTRDEYERVYTDMVNDLLERRYVNYRRLRSAKANDITTTPHAE